MSAKLIVIVMSVTLAACTSESAPSTTTTTAPTGSGRLVVIDDDGQVVVTEADGSEPVVVASAAEGTTLAQPIWSPDGSSVSWAKASPQGFAYVIHDLGTNESIEVALDQFPYYAFWSPRLDRIGTLRNGPSSVVFEVITLPTGEVELVEDDTPFYFSWSPDGERVVAHAGPARLLDLGLDGDDAAPEPTDDGYLSPQWLDSGVLHVESSEMVLTSGEERRPLAEVSGLTTFVANPQGDRVALQSISAGGGESVMFEEGAAAPPNVVTVVDIESGELTTVSDSPAFSFFWSPDGRSLLLLSLSDSRDSLVPSVWTEDGLSQYQEYLPSPIQVRDLFPFFPQYAQSLSFWAADSSGFVLVGEIDGESGVWVQDLDGSDPRRVSGGSWAAWSP